MSGLEVIRKTHCLHLRVKFAAMASLYYDLRPWMCLGLLGLLFLLGGMDGNPAPSAEDRSLSKHPPWTTEEIAERAAEVWEDGTWAGGEQGSWDDLNSEVTGTSVQALEVQGEAGLPGEPPAVRPCTVLPSSSAPGPGQGTVMAPPTCSSSWATSSSSSSWSSWEPTPSSAASPSMDNPTTPWPTPSTMWATPCTPSSWTGMEHRDDLQGGTSSSWSTEFLS